MAQAPRAVAYVAILAFTTITSFIAGFAREQIFSITIFTAIILGALLYWRFRVVFAFLGLGALFAAGVMDIEQFIKSAGLDIIMFLISMMTVVGFLEERRFFEAILDKILRLAGGSARKTVVLLMAMAALSAALVDEVTSILFISSAAIHLATRLGISIIPLIMMSVFATIIGSSATVVGNPIGVIIALKAKLSFFDFLRWATPISIVGLLMCIAITQLYFRRYLAEMDAKMKAQVAIAGVESSSSHSSKLGLGPTLLFLGTLAGLIFHTQIEAVLGLEKNTMLIGVAVIAAGVALLMERGKARELLERRVDWWTLSFFLLLFASVGTLQFTGVTEVFSSTLVAIGGGDFLTTFLFTGWTMGFMSAFMDNVLAVTLWIPIVEGMGDSGMNVYPLWWVLLFGGTFTGTLTYIGSTAGIVAVGLIERQRRGHVSLLEWIKVGSTVAIPTFSVALLLLYLQVPLMTG